MFQPRPSVIFSLFQPIGPSSPSPQVVVASAELLLADGIDDWRIFCWM